MWYSLVFFLFFLFPQVVAGDVLISEFSPDLTPQTVELINTSSESADISGWYIDDDGGTTYYTVVSGTKILPQSCILLSGNFNLNKTTADTIKLFNSESIPTASGAQILDSASYKGSPGFGNSYARIPDATGAWIATSSSFGLTNIDQMPCLTTEASPTPTPLSSPTPEAIIEPVASPTTEHEINNVWISGVLCFPETGSSEWIELYNNNNTVVSLSDWFIDDGENTGSSPKKISLTIDPYSYASIEISNSLFNNDKDTVRLLDPQRQQKDGFEYNKPTQGMTFSRISWENDEFCITNPTKNTINASCDMKTEATSVLPTSRPASSRSSVNTLPDKIEKTAVSQFDMTYTSPAVLGSASRQTVRFDSPEEKSSPVPQFSFLPASYSILTIASVFIRIWNGP